MTSSPEIRRYRPSNGTEGMAFFENWCERCAKDCEMNGSKPQGEADDSELCPIIAASMAYDVDDPKYPGEWIETGEGPICTAFVEFRHPVLPQPEDKRESWQKTLDEISGDA